MKNLKCGTKIKWGNWNLVVNKRNGRLTIEDFDNEDATFELSSYGWLDDDFKILPEENEEIDIDSIEFENQLTVKANNRMIEQLIKAVKQLNKKLEEK